MVLEDAELLVEEHKESIIVLAVALIRFGSVLEGADIEAVLEGLGSDDGKELLDEQTVRSTGKISRACTSSG